MLGKSERYEIDQHKVGPDYHGEGESHKR